MKNLHPVRKIVLYHNGVITRECGHEKTVDDGFNEDQVKWSVCHECTPLSEHWIDMETRYGNTEWICKHGIGHWDIRLSKSGVHGCDGCCARDDFPGNI